MRIQQFDVINPVLKPFIGFYYLLSTEDNKDPQPIRLILVLIRRLGFLITVQLRSGPKQAVVEKKNEDRFSEIIVGNALTPLQVTMSPGVKEFCIVFKPLGINHTQTTRMGETLRNGFKATDLFRDQKEIISLIINKEEGIELLEERLVSMLHETQELNNLQQIIQLLNTDANISFENISRKTFFSGKNIYRLFRSHLGISPAQFRSLVKFRKAVSKATDGNSKSRMAAIALDSGYYDQANLINEIRKITHLSPKNFLSAISLYADKKITWKME